MTRRLLAILAPLALCALLVAPARAGEGKEGPPPWAAELVGRIHELRQKAEVLRARGSVEDAESIAKKAARLEQVLELRRASTEAENQGKRLREEGDMDGAERLMRQSGALWKKSEAMLREVDAPQGKAPDREAAEFERKLDELRHRVKELRAEGKEAAAEEAARQIQALESVMAARRTAEKTQRALVEARAQAMKRMEEAQRAAAAAAAKRARDLNEVEEEGCECERCEKCEAKERQSAERAEHLHAAAEHLRAAGMNELADRVEREAGGPPSAERRRAPLLSDVPFVGPVPPRPPMPPLPPTGPDGPSRGRRITVPGVGEIIVEEPVVTTKREVVVVEEGGPHAVPGHAPEGEVESLRREMAEIRRQIEDLRRLLREMRSR
jgi:hypothetical protein